MAAVPVQVEEVNVAYPEAGELHLRLGLGACQLVVKPGDGQAWVSGTYRHPQDTLSLKIEQQGGTVRIGQETTRLYGLWDAFDRNTVPRFELFIGKGRQFDLTLELGASENEIDLGGLPISQLTIHQGAGKVTVDFSAPNPEPMKSLSLATGASGLEVRRLANANCSQMAAEGGAAGFVFDFGGELRRDMQVTINTGVAGVEVVVPDTTPLRATVESVLGGVSLGDGLMKKEGAYWNAAALSGRTPAINLSAKVALGELKLRS
jgi:hypothetical protein